MDFVAGCSTPALKSFLVNPCMCWFLFYTLGRGHSKSSLGIDLQLCIREKGRVQPVGFQISVKALLSKKKEQWVHFQCHLLDKMDNFIKGEKPPFSIYHHQHIPTVPSSSYFTWTEIKIEVVLISTSYSPHSVNVSNKANKPIVMKTFGCIKMTACYSCWEFRGSDSGKYLKLDLMRRAWCLGCKTYFCTGPILSLILEQLILLSEDSNEKVTIQDFFLFLKSIFPTGKTNNQQCSLRKRSRNQLVCHNKMEQTTALKRQVTSIDKEVQHRKYPRIWGQVFINTEWIKVQLDLEDEEQISDFCELWLIFWSFKLQSFIKCLNCLQKPLTLQISITSHKGHMDTFLLWQCNQRTSGDSGEYHVI